MADDPERDEKLEEFKRRVLSLQAQPGESDAAADAPEKTVTEKRVDVIFGMMTDGTWVSGRSDRVLAEAWKLTPERVRVLSAEASRRFKRLGSETAEDRAAMRDRVAQTFERLANKAESAGTPHALMVAGNLVALMAKYMGLEPAQKLEHTGADGAPLEPARVVVLPPKDELLDDV